MRDKKILIYILIVFLILVCLFLGYTFAKFKQGKYQAVQLSNGDVYYGKLRAFPCCKLTDVYFIQNVQGETGTLSQLQPLNSLFFGPENVMHLQRKQILWWADLAENSQILKTIKEGARD